MVVVRPSSAAPPLLSLQFWASSSGRSSPLTTSVCGSNRFCRNWTLESESSSGRSKRTMVTVALVLSGRQKGWSLKRGFSDETSRLG